MRVRRDLPDLRHDPRLPVDWKLRQGLVKRFRGDVPVQLPIVTISNKLGQETIVTARNNWAMTCPPRSGNFGPLRDGSSRRKARSVLVRDLPTVNLTASLPPRNRPNVPQ